MRTARIAGWGIALPEKVVTNDDLAAVLDTSDEWIRERSGIRERRIGGTTAGLAIESGQAALDHAGVAAKDIDLLVLATSTPSPTTNPRTGLGCSSRSSAAPSAGVRRCTSSKTAAS